MKSLLKIENLNVNYGQVNTLNDVCIEVNEGEVLGIVGESGSGKSTLLKSIIGLLDNKAKVTSGSIKFDNDNLETLSNEDFRKIRGSKLSMIFQNPGAYLCPIRSIEKQFIETVKSHKNTSINEIKSDIEDIFSKINLKDNTRILKSYPFELSGGMNQRVCIAMAMINKPKLILADEPTSALDVTAQAQVVKTLKSLSETFRTSILMVTHNIGIISYMADKVAVMYAGNVVEYGAKDDIIKNPSHPYTKSLIKATPSMKSSKINGIPGKPPSFSENTQGCPFVSRCDKKIHKCTSEKPKLIDVNNKKVSCHLYESTNEVRGI